MKNIICACGWKKILAFSHLCMKWVLCDKITKLTWDKDGTCRTYLLNKKVFCQNFATFDLLSFLTVQVLSRRIEEEIWIGFRIDFWSNVGTYFLASHANSTGEQCFLLLCYVYSTMF
jgi:hypothetical protein